jgi:ribonuclease HI
MTDQQQHTVVFTDGASKGNPGPGGWGVIVATPDGHVRELGGGTPSTTNNRMELTGAIQALTHLRHVDGPVSIYTDSTYVIQGIREWIHAWKRRDWKTATGTDVLNRDLWEELSGLTASRGSLEWHYVRGHAGTPGNERVDVIADSFAVRQPVSLYDGPAAGYRIALRDVPRDSAVPARSSRAARSATPFSYLSVVDGLLRRHATWAECEQRVKGQPGARFKKAMSETEQDEIIRAWNFSPDDL